MAEQAKIDFTIDGAPAVKTLGDLATKAEQLNEKLRGAEVGTEEYKKLSRELTNTNREVKNLEKGFEALDNEQVAGEMGKVAGAVGSISSAMILLGGENENLEKMAQNIQLALGVSMAFKGAIEGLSGVQKLWNGVISKYVVVQKIANAVSSGFSKIWNAAPWAVVLTVITAVIGAIKMLSGEVSNAEKKQVAMKVEISYKSLIAVVKSGESTMDQRNGAIDELNKLLPDSIGLINEQTIVTGEAIKMIEKHLKVIKERAELTALENSLVEIATKRMNTQMALTRDNGDLINGQLKRELEQQKELESMILSEIGLRQQELSATEGVTSARGKNTEEIGKEIEANIKAKEAKEANNTVEKETIDLTERRAAAQLELDKMIIDSMEEGVEKKKALAVFAFEQEIAALDSNLTEENELIKAKTLELQEELREIEILAMEDELVREIEQDFKLLEAQRLFDEEQKRLKDEKAEQDKADKEKAVALAKQGAQELFSVTQDLLKKQSAKELQAANDKVARGEKLTNAEIKRLKTQDKINKAFALAQIASDTARAVGGAIASAAGLPFPANLGAIASGIAAVLSGAAQAASIMGESVDIPSAASVTSDAQTNADGQGVPDIAAIGTGSTLLNQPNKVYVVDSDITNVQNNTKAIVAQATFN